MSSDDRILGYLDQIVEADSSGALKKAFDNIKCTIDEGKLTYPEGAKDPDEFCKELAELLKKRIRKEIADECAELIFEECLILKANARREFQAKYSWEKIMKIIRCEK